MRGGQRIKMLDNLKGNDTYSAIKENLKTEKNGGREWRLLRWRTCLRQKTNDDDDDHHDHDHEVIFTVFVIIYSTVLFHLSHYIFFLFTLFCRKFKYCSRGIKRDEKNPSYAYFRYTSISNGNKVTDIALRKPFEAFPISPQRLQLI